MMGNILRSIFGIFYNKNFYRVIMRHSKKKHYYACCITIAALLFLTTIPKCLWQYHENRQLVMPLRNVPTFSINHGKLIFSKPVHFNQLEKLTRSEHLVRFLSLKNKSEILSDKTKFILSEKDLYFKVSPTFKIIIPYKNLYIKKIRPEKILDLTALYFKYVLFLNVLKIVFYFLFIILSSYIISAIIKKRGGTEHDYFILLLMCAIPCCCYALFLSYYAETLYYQFIVIPLMYATYFYIMKKHDSKNI